MRFPKPSSESNHVSEQNTIKTDAEAMASSLATVQTAVAGFDVIAAGMAALSKAHPLDVVADASTKDGMQVLKDGYNAWKAPRLELERRRKEAKAPVVALGRNIDAFAGRLEEQLRVGENHYGRQIEAYKAEQARRAEEARVAEEQRKAKHEKALSVIRSYSAMATGLPSTRIAAGIAKLEAMRFGAEWEEYASRAVIAQTETLVQLRTMLDQAKASEAAAEAARIKQEEEARQREQDRIENERKAAELKAAAEALETKAAELRRREQEFDALREAVQQTTLAVDDKAFAVSEDQAAAARTTLGAKLADTPASMLTPAELAIARQQAQQDAEPLRADAVAAAEQAAQRQQAPHLAVVPKAAEEPTVKLGEINALMGEGFSMTESFVTKTLGIVKPPPPAGSRGVLFLPSQVHQILTALAEHALSART